MPNALKQSNVSPSHVLFDAFFCGHGIEEQTVEEVHTTDATGRKRVDDVRVAAHGGPYCVLWKTFLISQEKVKSRLLEANTRAKEAARLAAEEEAMLLKPNVDGQGILDDSGRFHPTTANLLGQV
jgi:hypothetical protein